MSLIFENIGLIAIILLGMVSGSFMTMASHRLAIEGESIKDLLLHPSSCVKCGNRLGALNLIPIFSWIFQGGACAFCKTKISIRYPIIELCCTIGFVAIYFHLDQTVDAKLVLYLLMFLALFLMIITDLENYFISDFNQFVMFVLIGFYHFFVTFAAVDVEYSLAYFIFSSSAYLIFGIVLHFVFKYSTCQDGIGVDDIKFFAVAGFLIGLDQFAVFMFLSGFIGIIFGIIWQKLKDDTTFPFAPSLILALIISHLTNFDQFKIFY